ncbi:MAG: prolyl oligopeptidase family serine peptidase [Ginsengibacter sp.]
MKSPFIFLFLFMTITSYAQINYPVTQKSDQQDDYFGKIIKDPYRWLEDDNSKETKAWVLEQNKVTDKYLASIPFRDKVKSRLTELFNYPKFSAPFRKGEYLYFYKNDGLQNQSVLYRQKGLSGKPEVFIDPNKLSAHGTTSIGTPVFSKNNTLATYFEAQAGSDWQIARVMNVRTGNLLNDELRFIKFSQISWKGDEGFFYSRYPAASEDSILTGQNRFHSIYYHKIGEPQEKDALVFQDLENPLRIMSAGITRDNRFIFVIKSEGTSGNELWVKDLSKKDSDFKLIIEGFKNQIDVIDSHGDRLLVRTNIQAPNYQLVSIDPANPSHKNWKTVLAEKKDLLQSVGKAGGKLFPAYLKDASSKIFQTNYDGVVDREVKLPGIGTATGFDGGKEDQELFYSFSSFNNPGSIFKYHIKSGKTELYQKSEANFDSENYTVKQVFFKSKDGTRVPMFITHKKGMVLDGNNPLLLYGYGGFNIPMTPAFSISNAFFLEQGGVYVVVNLRGGNEYGEAWHKGGMLQNKQNVFDDFIGAAEYLIANKYTNPEKLAIRGGSNGGLLVGAAMTQRPELFKVAIPQVGVLDMLRYHLFTIGWAWATEYGRSDNEKDFKNLIKYSPLHNLKKGVKYPATLITTADHDDRVVPAHSFKFAAELQDVNDGSNPTLIRIETQAGHGAGKPTAKIIEEAADIWSFIMFQVGMTY